MGTLLATVFAPPLQDDSLIATIDEDDDGSRLFCRKPFGWKADFREMYAEGVADSCEGSADTIAEAIECRRLIAQITYAFVLPDCCLTEGKFCAKSNKVFDHCCLVFDGPLLECPVDDDGKFARCADRFAAVGTLAHTV